MEKRRQFFLKKIPGVKVFSGSLFKSLLSFQVIGQDG
jgi:hypothetical protein